MKIRLQPDGPSMREPSESEMDDWLANLREDDAAEPADTPTATEAEQFRADQAGSGAPAPEAGTGPHRALQDTGDLQDTGPQRAHPGTGSPGAGPADAPAGTGPHRVPETSGYAGSHGSGESATATGPHELITTSGSTGPFAILPPKTDQPYASDPAGSGALPVLSAPTAAAAVGPDAADETDDGAPQAEATAWPSDDGDVAPEASGVDEADGGTGLGSADAPATGAWAPETDAADAGSWAPETETADAETPDAWTPGPWAPGAETADPESPEPWTPEAQADEAAPADGGTAEGTWGSGSWTPRPQADEVGAADTGTAEAAWAPGPWTPEAHADEAATADGGTAEGAWTPAAQAHEAAPANGGTTEGAWAPAAQVDEATTADGGTAGGTWGSGPWTPGPQAGESAPADAATAGGWAAEAAPAEASVAEIGAAEIDAPEIGPAEIGPAEDDVVAVASEPPAAAAPLAPAPVTPTAPVAPAAPVAPGPAAGSGEYRVVPVGRRRMLIPGGPPPAPSETPVRALIGEQLRTPIVWCELERTCISWHADREALGVADVRARAIAAGWRVDALGRLACPQCQQTSNAFRTTQPVLPWNRAYALTMAARQAARQGNYQYPQPAFYPR